MNKIFINISVSAKEINQNAYIIGQYVLSFLIKKNKCKYVDIFTEGSVIKLASKVSKKFYNYPILTFFKRFNTARFKIKNNYNQIEFIGCRNNIIHIASIAISLNINNYGLLIDNIYILNICNHFYKNIINIIRSIRFSIELLLIEQISFYCIFEQRKLIRMFSIEGTINDFNKILLSQNSFTGLSLLYEVGLLSVLLPEVTSLKEFEEKEGSNHKDNFIHTLDVLENVSKESNSLWLRWVALLHDIGKYITKKYILGIGWTFYIHEYIGARLIPYIFYRLKFPMNWIIKYIQKIIQYSSRPIPLGSYEATDSAIRRLLFYLGWYVHDLLLLCRADITTKNVEKKLRYVGNFLLVEKKLQNIDIKDNIKKWLTSISGDKIMQFFNIKPSPQIGLIKTAIKEAILNGRLTNDFYLIYSFMLKKGKKLDFILELRVL